MNNTNFQAVSLPRVLVSEIKEAGKKRARKLGLTKALSVPSLIEMAWIDYIEKLELEEEDL